MGNATRLANLPTGQEYAMIAVVPWFSGQCMLEYFAAARRASTRSIFVYQPGQGNARPPVLNDASWNLQDGGRWQSVNTFPTYALSSTTGSIIMNQMGLYSGNLTSVPNGEELATTFDRRDYIRLWAQVATGSDTQLPSLWVFLVIVLAILIVAVTCTSVAMHIIQRRRRRDLHRRVLEGEVDLEALGVKRLTVSQETLDKLPIYTYTGESSSSSEKSEVQVPPPALGVATPFLDIETGAKAHPLARRLSTPSSTGATSTAWSQATCPICLDDFEANETKVRELPCRHIFHPDCIDQFLLQNSSLCPMCKQSVLPPGACPVNITNMMVRRERHIARMRAQGTSSSTAQSDISSTSAAQQPVHIHPPPSGPLGSLRGRIGGAMAGRRIFSAPERTQSRPADIEMGNSNTTTTPSSALPHISEQRTPTSATPTNAQACAPAQNRREWARQRALHLLGNRHAPASDIQEEHTGPRWRRTLDKVFPGFR